VLPSTDATRPIDEHKVMALAAALPTGFAVGSDRK
jgi:hypothetical protein